MLRHADIWVAIDRLAHDRGLTASGLARRSGLDPTTFNKSKRVTREGKPRWPSTESISKILDATGATLSEFLAMLPNEPSVDKGRGLPLISSIEVIARNRLDGRDLILTGDHDEISFPDGHDAAFAVEVADSALSPAYREGDVLIVSPSAQIRRGDRVLLRLSDGRVVAAEFLRRTSRQLSFRSLAEVDATRALPVDQVSWLARILWASQ